MNSLAGESLETSIPRSARDAPDIPAAASLRDLRRTREKLRIEKAALRLLLERGFDNVTADDFAEAAQISRRTFFRYFPARDDVLTGVYMRSLNNLFHLIRSRPSEESLIEAVANASRMDVVPSDDPDEIEIARLTMQLLAENEEAWERSEGHTRNTILQGYTEVVAYRLGLAGRDPAGAPIVAASLWAASCNIFLQWLSGGMRGNMPDLLLSALQTVRDALAFDPASDGKTRMN